MENAVLAGRNKFFDSSMSSIVGSRGEDRDQGGEALEIVYFRVGVGTDHDLSYQRSRSS